MAARLQIEPIPALLLHELVGSDDTVEGLGTDKLKDAPRGRDRAACYGNPPRASRSEPPRALR
jgi:hypothetical protein